MLILSWLWWVLYFVFFFKQKTAYEMRISDWSSDVCSSDLSTRDSNSEHLTASAIVTGSASRERRVQGPWEIQYPAGARDDGLTTILSERRSMSIRFIAA